MPKDTPTTYGVRARSTAPGVAEIITAGPPITIDTSPDTVGGAPGPAEMLAGAFAACTLKNVERFARMLPFAHTGAWITVEATRQATPPRFTHIAYRLHVRTAEPAERVELLHRNIRRHGTVYNTLAAVCEVTGRIIAEPPDAPIP